MFVSRDSAKKSSEPRMLVFFFYFLACSFLIKKKLSKLNKNFEIIISNKCYFKNNISFLNKVKKKKEKSSQEEQLSSKNMTDKKIKKMELTLFFDKLFDPIILSIIFMYMIYFAMLCYYINDFFFMNKIINTIKKHISFFAQFDLEFLKERGKIQKKCTFWLAFFSFVRFNFQMFYKIKKGQMYDQ
ncbi:hypothetical protein RFI_30794 [Reticulomyxa filosa]|uniref:Uncharacterized protein n=1 Tax=Reticulomyxa filosa TaxID=46433 RepID=X6LXC1_RETFI|nr:hypothetical protein RFI_30794 [Reticulomyxa filosa]|eukprot:ETO06598.1 hypothetical protein RFI_30794 [Reticulomyxa filosa]